MTAKLNVKSCLKLKEKVNMGLRDIYNAYSSKPNPFFFSMCILIEFNLCHSDHTCIVEI